MEDFRHTLFQEGSIVAFWNDDIDALEEGRVVDIYKDELHIQNICREDLSVDKRVDPRHAVVLRHHANETQMLMQQGWRQDVTGLWSYRRDDFEECTFEEAKAHQAALNSAAAYAK
jgi:hypothetical protein